MELFEKIQHLLNKPEIKLLAGNNADFVLSFLYQEFKERDKIPKSELLYNLKFYISQLQSEERSFQDAKFYINEWQTTEKPYLKTLYFDQDEREFIIQPTIHVKHVFQWLDNLQTESVISSQIGFEAILEMLKNLVFGTLENPDEKLGQLKKEKEKIEEQIDRLEKLKMNDENVELLDTYLIQDTYKKLVKDSERLIFDFEVVADQYSLLKENIKDKFNIKKLSRGKILGDLFSEEKALHETSIVKSYNSFRTYLRPENTDELNSLLEKIHSLPDVQFIEDNFFKNLTNNLWQASLKIGAIDEEIFSWLRNIFDKNYQEKIKKTYLLIQEIKKKIIENKDNYPDKEVLIEIEGKPEIYAHKEYVEPKTTIKFAKKRIKKHNNTVPSKIKKNFAESFYFDIDVLKSNINKILLDKKEVSLKEVLEEFPIKQGLPELLAYTMLASEDGNKIYHSQKQVIKYDTNYEVTLPLIIFKNELE